MKSYRPGAWGCYPGKSQTVSFILTAPQIPGTYYLWLGGSLHYSIPQAVEEYTQALTLPAHANIVVTPPSPPDLMPQIQGIYRVSPDIVMLVFRVINNGPGQSPGGYPVSILLNSNVYGSVGSDPLQLGQSTLYQIPIHIPYSGVTYLLQVQVDPNNAIQETNEGNNITPPVGVQ